MINKQLATELNLNERQVEQTVALLDGGNTIPFIARYRKEQTGELDEVQLRRLAERLTYLRNLVGRKEEVKRLIDEQGKLTAELAGAIGQAVKLQELEDLYRPYRPKRRTRATMARERGLAPLAQLLLGVAGGRLAAPAGSPLDWAADYLADEVPDAEAALAGARDIIAEELTDDPAVRQLARTLTEREGVIEAKGTGEGTEARGEFEMYKEFSEPLRSLPPHRILALNRGEARGALKVSLTAPKERILGRLKARYLANPASLAGAEVGAALEDGYGRLLAPSLEREVRASLTEVAEARAIHLFAENLRGLLLQPPIRGLTVLGLDPGYRTGTKGAVVDPTGKVLEHLTVYITAGSERQLVAGKAALLELLRRHRVDLVAIGNGTASRETEEVVAELLPQVGHRVAYLIVNEAGASVYSASPLGTEEFPDLDVSIRGAISIARRAQDPLAELVKIEPKAIGVGLYQHDVNQRQLGAALDAVVESCVNAVGVDLNTASASLLTHVAGLRATVARAVVAHREAHGAFRSRAELKKVAGLGPKAFEQAAGFLRISDGKEPLDNTSVHPESYGLARSLLQALGKSRQELVGVEVGQFDAAQLAAELGAGLPTVRDILAALARPGRDPRDELPKPLVRSQPMRLEDLNEGMILTGTVRNVIDFGAFVDLGVHQDGLVHISELADRFVRHPSEVVSVGDVVKVRVLGVDLGRQRISLSMKGLGS